MGVDDKCAPNGCPLMQGLSPLRSITLWDMSPHGRFAIQIGILMEGAPYER